MAGEVPDKLIARRLKKTIYWVRKTFGKTTKRYGLRTTQRVERGPFWTIHERARKIINESIRKASSPLQIPELRRILKEEHNLTFSHSLLRRYLRHELGMRYRVLGVVGEQYDSHKNLMLRQLAAQEYIATLSAGKDMLNIDESIIRTSD